MAGLLTRRKIARYYAEKLVAGDRQQLMRELAGYLIETGRTKELDVLVRDIEEDLANAGIIIADVTTARPMNDELRREVQTLIEQDTTASRIELREHVDATLLGGVRIELPGHELDLSLKRKLISLRARKV